MPGQESFLVMQTPFRVDTSQFLPWRATVWIACTEDIIKLHPIVIQLLLGEFKYIFPNPRDFPFRFIDILDLFLPELNFIISSLTHTLIDPQTNQFASLSKEVLLLSKFSRKGPVPATEVIVSGYSPLLD